MAENWKHTRLDHRTRQAASIAASALSLLIENGAPALTMAAIANHAEISRQTLYRYYQDVDAVLVGVAELVTSHDEAFAQLVGEQPDPNAQLDLIINTATSDDHANHDTGALLAVLPPAGREIVAQHEARSSDLLAKVLQNGIDRGSFRHDLRPETDAPLILGLLTAAKPSAAERAGSLVLQLVEPQPEGAKK